MLFVYGDGQLTPDQLRKKETDQTLVYLGTHLTPVAELADVVLPTAAWSEKPGLYANAEGRVQESVQATLPPLNAKEDWKIFRALSGELNKPLPFDTFAQLRAALEAAHPAYALTQRNLVPASTPTKPSVTDASALSRHSLASPLTPQNYYLSTFYHRQSPTLHSCQAEALNPLERDPKPSVHAPARRANHGATQGLNPAYEAL